uniref:Uncharacterized protein n=1 Tax=Panagrolaimus davidi TaxID=227884 RepID=A0A914Q4E2_9BILA
MFDLVRNVLLYNILDGVTDVIYVRSSIYPGTHELHGHIIIPGLAGVIIGRVDAERNAEIIAWDDAIRLRKLLGVYINNAVANVITANCPAGNDPNLPAINATLAAGLCCRRNS